MFNVRRGTYIRDVSTHNYLMCAHWVLHDIATLWKLHGCVSVGHVKTFDYLPGYGVDLYMKNLAGAICQFYTSMRCTYLHAAFRHFHLRMLRSL